MSPCRKWFDQWTSIYRGLCGNQAIPGFTTAKGVAAAFAGPGAAWLFAKTGSWSKVFWAMIVCDLIAAFMALLWLKPLAARAVRTQDNTASLAGIAAPAKARGVA